ncbi:MAG: ABC-2 transporter permease, partial [Peptostreptococcaceae bacterium]
LLLVNYIVTICVFYTLLNPFAYSFASVFFSYLILSTSFSHDNENDSNRFIMSMPVNKEDIVYSKYIFGFGLIVIITAINNIIIELLSGMYFRGPVLDDIYGSMIVYLILTSIVLPTFFLFKNQNISKFIGVVVSITLFFTIGMFLILNSDIGASPDGVIIHIGILRNMGIDITLYNLSILSLIIYIFSMFVSLKIVKRKNGGKRYEKVC